MQQMPLHLDQPSPGDIEVLLSHARTLKRAREPILKQQLLKGRNLALLCESVDDPDAALFMCAASEMGAHVSHIRPSLTDLATPSVRRVTARMLGRLYDGVECQGLPAQLVEQLGRDADVPFYDDIAGTDHPTAKLVGLLEGDESDESKRLRVLQTVLLATLV